MTAGGALRADAVKLLEQWQEDIDSDLDSDLDLDLDLEDNDDADSVCGPRSAWELLRESTGKPLISTPLAGADGIGEGQWSRSLSPGAPERRGRSPSPSPAVLARLTRPTASSAMRASTDQSASLGLASGLAGAAASLHQ